MIIYNKTWLAKLRLQKQLQKDADTGVITKEEFKAIAAQYPVGFYTPHLMVRIGLFILTSVIVLFADGLISLFLAQTDIITTYGWFIFLGLLTYGGLEIVIKNNFHYQSGVDDALLVIAGCQLAAGFAMWLFKDTNNGHMLISMMIFIIAVYLTLRCANMLAAAITCLAFFAFVFFGWINFIPHGLATAPFIMMATSAMVYWLANRFSKQLLAINYTDCLTIAQVISLLTLYASGNYYVIQTLSADMAGRTGPVPFGNIFWIWTIAVPFVYIGLGIRKKDVVLIRSGLILVVMAAVTFRNYYHILPVDISLCIVGSVILAIVYSISKYLKTPQHGFTVEEAEDVNLMDHLRVESLIVADTFSHAPSAPTDDGWKFGGGSSGGGGSAGDF